MIGVYELEYGIICGMSREFTSHQLSDATRIARGPDSIVHKVGEFVVKQYPYLTYTDVVAYQEANNLLSASLLESPISKKGRIGIEEWSVQFLVHPILHVNDSQPVTAVSRYVSGQNGFNILKNYLAGNFLDGDNLPNLTGRSSLVEFADLTNPVQVLDRLAEITNVVNRPTISRVNTKIHAEKSKYALQVTVTDFASHISELKYK